MLNILLSCLILGGALFLLLCGCTPPPEPAPDPAPEEPEMLRAALTVRLNGETPISDTLFGIFLEDINYAVDAGLYAELIQNRSFEYGCLAADGPKHGWEVTDRAHVRFEIADGSRDASFLHENNPHYAVVTNTAGTPEGIYSTGYLDGLAVTGGQRYRASLYVRGDARIQLSLEGRDGSLFARASIDARGSVWTRYSAVLTPDESTGDGLRFAVRISRGTVHLDMVSLMPEDTFAGLPIRKDLGESLWALNPAFLRFPGGCVIEGRSEDSMYRWKDSIGAAGYTVNGKRAAGDPASRPQVTDIWRGDSRNPYYCSYGLGFYEYFLLCEALECLPIPVLNAGMTCPVQSEQYLVYPLSGSKFKQCVQDALDLVEFCRGGPDTAWGAVRIAMGHEAPFPLKYIAIGNEQWQREYHDHYGAFVKAFRSAARENPALYADLELIVANGPVSGNTEGWSYITRHPDGITTLVDEHYYESPAWFLTNNRRYDAYPRDRGMGVFLGEYAAQSNTMNAALAEAAYMTALERNGDLVKMACYAPLFGNSMLNQWQPDLIFFSNRSVYGTPNYYVQQMFAGNAGCAYLDTALRLSAAPARPTLSGGAGLGSWMTSVAYDNLKVVSCSGTVLYENGFGEADSFRRDFDRHEGNWSVRGGRLVQTGTAAPRDPSTGDTVYFGSAGWTDYTLTVEGRILDGSEGFLIPICVRDPQNNLFWNIGGWGNTVSCLQAVSGGVKSGQITGTVRRLTLEKGRTYRFTVTVSGSSIRCWIDGRLYVDYTEEAVDPVYASTVRAANGDLILKIVNVSGEAIPVDIHIPGLDAAYGSAARVTRLSAGSGCASNSFSEPHNIRPQADLLAVSDRFSYEAVPYSLTVLRVRPK